MLRTILYRSLAFTVILGMVNIGLPLGLARTFGPNPYVKVAEPAPQHQDKPKESRPLSLQQMRTLAGRQSGSQSAQNPYIAGSGKWGVPYNGVDLLTGNYTVTATDLSFDPSYGVPVNVTRSYSSNMQDEGPLGFGWTLSVDVRSTAGGVLKSSASPVLLVPLNFKERPSTQTNDPNAPMGLQPVAAVVGTDASGVQETIQKDVDGVLTTPPWDNNTLTSTYETIVSGDDTYQILQSTTTTTPDGTVYCYSNHGYYSGGMQPWGETQTPTGQPSNILKVDTVTDRQGNVTNYTYLSGAQQPFAKYNGNTMEDPLIGIKMPDGRKITFTWGTGAIGSINPVNRIVSVSDGLGRTVLYSYYDAGQLWTETDPSGVYPSGSDPIVRTTTYGYSQPTCTLDGLSLSSNDVLTSITDPRGLVTTIEYCIEQEMGVPPYEVPMPAVVAYRVHDTAGIDHFLELSPKSGGLPSDFPSVTYEVFPCLMIDMGVVNGNHTVLRCSAIVPYLNTQNAYFIVQMDDDLIQPVRPEEPIFGSPPAWSKTYDAYSQDLMEETHYTEAFISDDLSAARQLTAYDSKSWETDQVNTYNFQGNPLTQTVNEYTSPTVGSGYANTRTTTTSYAYWDQSKYYQQKAVMDNAGRYTFTDYYPNSPSTPPGSTGQKEYVYGPNNPNYWLNTALAPNSPPPGSQSWAYEIQPYNASLGQANLYGGAFQYDSVGRVVDVWKVRAAPSSGPWTYTCAQTTYEDDTIAWGEAQQVTEDYGGATPRTTTNTAWTPWGKPCTVLDADGYTFATTYQLTGDVQSVVCTTTGQTLASYTYGPTSSSPGPTGPISNGVPVTVFDGITGVTQSIGYQYSSSLPGLGQVASVTEQNGINPASTVSYTYTPLGDRSTANYSTADGAVTWLYTDYIPVGSFEQGKRAFQTLNQLNGTNETAEEMHYQYDTAGRLRQAAFAQSPQTGSGAPTSAPFYTASYPAASRAVAFYDYDGGGRQIDLQQGWQTWSGSAYNATVCVLRNSCQYGNALLPLKTGSTFWGPETGAPTVWAATRQESYGYDPYLDYLTGANYDDGLPNATPVWSYDGAGNRTDSGSTFDDLNRLTSLQGTAATNNACGDRLSLGSTTNYDWDVLHRMSSLTISGTTSNYEYRADGMRTHKKVGSVNTEYYHDGQMAMEDAVFSGGTYTVTRYGLGARGLDYMQQGTATSRPLTTYSTVVFPLYDAHGNMIATLARSGSGSFTLGNQRSFDAWGAVRQGATTGVPSQRYCANLGHQQDDESGLIYMRARYYEPESGGFISEDPSMEGPNWFAYANSNPVMTADQTGFSPTSTWVWAVLGGLGFVGGFTSLFGLDRILASTCGRLILLTGMASLAVYAVGTDINGRASGDMGDRTSDFAKLFLAAMVSTGIIAVLNEVALSPPSLAENAICGLAAYEVVIAGYLAVDEVESAGEGPGG